MKNLLAPDYRDSLAFRWLALSGLEVLLCRSKRDANMFLVKLGNSTDSLFECRALSTGRGAPVIEVWLGGCERRGPSWVLGNDDQGCG